jgi:hypothetical protein
VEAAKRAIFHERVLETVAREYVQDMARETAA